MYRGLPSNHLDGLLCASNTQICIAIKFIVMTRYLRVVCVMSLWTKNMQDCRRLTYMYNVSEMSYPDACSVNLVSSSGYWSGNSVQGM